MKKIKSYIVLAGLISASTLFAQKPDTLLRRQMELEREFNPTLQDANKINSVPSLPQPVIKKANTAYSNWAGRTTPPLEIALAQPGNAMTEIPYDKKRGYIGAAAGNNGNIDGIFGYRIVDGAKDKLNFTYLLNSSNSDIEYVQENSNPAKNNAYWLNNLGQFGYQRLSNAFTLNLGTSYQHTMFNYYGNTFSPTRWFENKKQNVGVFSLNGNITSADNETLNYKAGVDYKNFSSKFGQKTIYKGLSGNQFDAVVGLEKPFQSGSSRVGIDGQIFGVFNDVPSSVDYDDVFLIKGAPYIRFSGNTWNAKLGANIIFKFADKDRLYFTPNVDLSLNVTERSSLYATIGGGVDNNGFLDMMDESRYVHPMTYVKPSFSLIDMEVGAKIGEVNGFRFDIFGGYKKTSDEHFLIRPKAISQEPGGTTDNLIIQHETLRPVYADLNISFIGGRLQTNIWSPLNLSLSIKKNIHSVNDMTIDNLAISDAKAYNEPGFEADIKATFEAMANLKFTLNYYFAGDRWSYFDSKNVKMNSINDLNLGAVYQFTDWLSVNAKANNLLIQKYDIWYGFPAQGLNFMGGVTIKF